MILLFVGNPGSGKTYEAVSKIVANLALGREVYTNIYGLDDPNCRHVIKELSDLDDHTFEHSLHFLKPEQVSTFYEFISDNSIVVIDECHKFWNSRDFQKTDNRRLSDWAAEHRHHGNDVIFLTQKPSKLDSQVRSLAEWTHEFRKLNMLGSLVRNGYQCFIYEGEPEGKPLSTQFRKYKPKFFKAYQSHITSDIKELGVTKAPNILHHWSIYACFVSLLVCGYFFSKSSFSSGQVLDYKVNAQSKQVKNLDTVLVDRSGPSVRTADREPDKKLDKKKPVIEINQQIISEQLSPLPDVDNQLIWFPVTAFLKTSTEVYVYIGNHRLQTWIQLSKDNKYVQIDKFSVPPPVLDEFNFLSAVR